MSERFHLARLRNSVFAKLFGIMLGLGLVIPLVVGGFFILLVRPTLYTSWQNRHELAVAHNWLLLLVLALLVVMVFTAHALLRRALKPLRWLQEGVVALSEGNLDVVVPRRTKDEFGALTDAFNHMVGRVREMVRSRDQLLLDVSHELRSPLTRMKVALELGPEDTYKPRLAANVAEMEAMVIELLELERLRQGRGLQIERNDLVRLVREVVEVCEGQPPGVRLGVTPEKVVLEMDPEKVRSVLGNLLENAAKYSLPGSGPVCVSIAEREGAAVVKVEDDGPGIPEEDLPSLFEPFFRVDRSRSRKTGGYGLGLSLCKRIMEAHGGSIAVENRPSRGAAFVLTFPRPGRDARIPDHVEQRAS